MNVYEKIIDTLSDLSQDTFTSAEIKKLVNSKYKVNPASIMPYDYCYNRLNKGISFDKYIFVRLSRDVYKFVGENYKYTGPVYCRPQGFKADFVAGHWENGKFTPI